MLCRSHVTTCHLSSNERGSITHVLCAHFVEHLQNIPNVYFPSRKVQVDEHGSHKHVQLKTPFGHHVVNMLPFSNRIRRSIQLHHYWESQAVRQSSYAVHLREQNDDFKGILH